MERCVQFKAESDNLLLAKMDERRGDFDASLACAGSNELLKRLIIRGPAVGISGAVLLDRADEDSARAEDFRPAYGGGEKVRVAKGDIGYGNGFANGLVLGSFGDADARVGEGGASDAAEKVDFKVQEVVESQSFGNGTGGVQLAAFCTLSIAEVKGVGIVIAGGESSTNGGIHSSGEADNSARAVLGHRFMLADGPTLEEIATRGD